MGDMNKYSYWAAAASSVGIVGIASVYMMLAILKLQVSAKKLAWQIYVDAINQTMNVKLNLGEHAATLYTVKNQGLLSTKQEASATILHRSLSLPVYCSGIYK